jgi:hypothetical protein
MIPVPSGVRVWLTVGRTDMRRGMNGLALQVQEALQRDPHAGDLYVFRGARGNLNSLARRPWHVAVCQEVGEGPVHLAIAGRRGDRISAFAARLHARRNRLAEPGPYFPAGACRIIGDAPFFRSHRSGFMILCRMDSRLAHLQTTSKH